MPNAELVSVREAAAILDVDPKTVHRMIEDGRLAAQRKFPGLRGAYILHRSDVEALAAGRANEPSP